MKPRAAATHAHSSLEITMKLSRAFAIAVFAGLSAGAFAQDKPAPAGLAKATFAAGCFWCVE